MFTSFFTQHPLLGTVYYNIVNQWGIVFIIALWLVPFLLKKFLENKTEKSKNIVLIVRMTMFWLFMFFVVKDILFSDIVSHQDSSYLIILKLIESAFVIVLAVVSYNIVSHVIDIKIESKKRSGGSRAGMKLLAAATIVIVTFISLVNVSGLNEIFETGSIIGMTGLLLGLTSPIWFPDLFSGLVIIFSNLFQEEQIVEIEEFGIYGIVDKIGVFNTTFRNYVNQHKISKSNSEVRKATINNLSKLASIKGIREELVFNIGYKQADGSPMTFCKVEAMCQDAFDKAKIHKLPITIEFEQGFELYLVNPGDHALEFHLYYISKDIKKRLQNRYNLYRVFYSRSIKHNIGLNTPVTHEVLSASINSQAIVEDELDLQEKRSV